MNHIELHTVLDDDVTPALDGELRALLVTCFTETPEFAEHRHWHEKPLRRWFLRDGPGRMVAHACIHDKHMATDTGTFRVGGITDVCVHPEYRAKGLVKHLLSEIHLWLTQHDYPFAMLFGKAEVYASSGYQPVANPLRFVEWNTGKILTEVRPEAMIAPLGQAQLPGGVIDLQGLIF